jgi:predicted DNA-binding helix-hairpin-helix protein
MAMDIEERLNLLGQAAQYDACAEAGEPVPFAQDLAPPSIPPGDLRHYVTHVIAKGGRRMPVMKVLQTSACEKNCFYCPFRAGRNFRREAVEPEELARLFDQMWRQRLVEGLFLSSGIIGTRRTQDRMLATVELVRRKYGFPGYIHLKLLPNAEPAQIERAVQLADRVSVNLEAPNPERLARLAPKKDFGTGLLETLRQAARYIRAGEGRYVRAGQTTQFVVGAAGESDREILNTSQMLYDEIGLARAYYSAFSPVPDTPLESQPPASPLREHRLYQSDFLLRRYGFRMDELIFDEQGHLPLHTDPKTAWAEAHRELFPLELNRAPRELLLRVPGIGPRGARRLLDARRRGTLRSLSDLERLGIASEKAAPYVLLAGRRPPIQLRFSDL